MWFQFLFFSMVTQSTTGYGSIVPLTPVAQLCTSIHMLLSVVYTTVIFGVGMSHYYNFHNDPDFARVTVTNDGGVQVKGERRWIIAVQRPGMHS